jgi:hypothetical protein
MCSDLATTKSSALSNTSWNSSVTFVLPQVVEVYKDVPVERPIERVVEVVKEGKLISC